MKNGQGRSDRRGARPGLRTYLDSIRRYPLLTASGERSLAVESRQGVDAARRALVEANLRLVVKIALSYRTFGVPLEDLVSEGNIGLMEAARRFDPTRGVRFANYASWWIRKCMVAALHRNATQSSYPVRLGPPGNAGAEGISPSTSIRTRRRLVSYEAFLTDSGEPRMQRALPRDEALDPEEVVLERDLADSLRSILHRIPAAERRILESRFGLDGRSRRTLQGLGELLGCTRERVRQLELRALERARRLLDMAPRPPRSPES
jgi:RNA polymerase primary sigma factor